jgi:hypothetical protein
MGIFGINAVKNLYPGQIRKMLGKVGLPGTLVTDANESLPALTASSPVVIASQPGAHPSTQRQITWRISGNVAGLALQGSLDNVAANYQTVDTSVGNADGIEVRTVPADNSATPGPGLQTATKIVSSARFWRVYNTTDGAVVATVDIACQ